MSSYERESGPQGSPPRRQLRWSILRFAAPFAMTLAAFVLITLFVDLDQMFKVLASVRPVYVVGVGFVAASMIALTVPRMQLILRQLDAMPTTAGFLLRLNFFTAIVGYMVPFSVLADGARAAVLWAESRMSPTLALEVSLQDRALALFGFILGGIVLTPFQPLAEPTARDVVAAQNMTYWAGALAIIAVVILGETTRKYVDWKWVGQVRALALRLLGNVVRPAFLFPHLVLMALSTAFYALMLWLSLRAVGVDGIGYWVLVTVTPGLAISQNIPVFYLGWGSREAVAAVLLAGVAGIEPSHAVAASLLVGVGVFLGSLPGLLFVGRFARSRRDG